MLFKRISRATAETMFMVVQNVSGSTLAANNNCVFDTGASADGVRVTAASATTLAAYAGVADADITNNAFGLIQIYGFRTSVLVDTNTTSLAAGSPLEPFTTSSALRGVAFPADGDANVKRFAFAAEAVASSASSSTSFRKAFIRAL